MSLKVLDPGPLTTVQDAGRTGYAAKGYRVCGAADSYAYRLGNMLIGNAPGAAVLECTLRGAALQFETDTRAVLRTVVCQSGQYAANGHGIHRPAQLSCRGRRHSHPAGAG